MLIENRKIKEPIAWIMKYFILLSVFMIVLFRIRMKINLIRLSSIPIQIINQEYDEIANTIEKTNKGMIISL